MKRTRIGTASTDARLRERPPETLTSAALARKKPMNIDPLLIRLDVQPIVDQSHQEQKRSRAYDHPALRSMRNQNQISSSHHQPDGDAAHHRRWILVPTIRLRLRDKSPAPRQRAH